MLTIEQFDKTELSQRRAGQRHIKMTPKEPIAGLEGLAITIFTTGWSQGDSQIWGWKWRTEQGMHDSSISDGMLGTPAEHHFNPQSAAAAALKSADYWSDEVRIPREERERAQRQEKQAQLDRQVHRFLDS